MSAIRTVGIVGAGTMGRRIAFGCAASGIASRLYDITPGVAEHAVEWVREPLDIRPREGRLTRSRALGRW